MTVYGIAKHSNVMLYDTEYLKMIRTNFQFNLRLITMSMRIYWFKNFMCLPCVCDERDEIDFKSKRKKTTSRTNLDYCRFKFTKIKSMW